MVSGSKSSGSVTLLTYFLLSDRPAATRQYTLLLLTHLLTYLPTYLLTDFSSGPAASSKYPPLTYLLLTTYSLTYFLTGLLPHLDPPRRARAPVELVGHLAQRARLHA